MGFVEQWGLNRIYFDRVCVVRVGYENKKELCKSFHKRAACRVSHFIVNSSVCTALQYRGTIDLHDYSSNREIITGLIISHSHIYIQYNTYNSS